VILDFNYAMRRMEEDKLFALLYQVCEATGEDTDKIVTDARKVARLTGETPLMTALIFRENIVGRMNRKHGKVEK